MTTTTSERSTQKRWADEEVNFLREHYPTEGAEFVAAKIGRTVSAVWKKAGKLKIRANVFWTNEELSFLRNFYPSRGAFYCSYQLGRTEKATWEKAEKMGLQRYKRTYEGITIVYTLPRCGKCDTLKKWLREHGITFQEKLFDANAQTNMIMRNVFGDPPVFKTANDEVIASDWSFDKNDNLREHMLIEFLNKNLGPKVGRSQYETHVYCANCGIWIWKEFAGDRCDVCGQPYRKKPDKWKKRHHRAYRERREKERK